MNLFTNQFISVFLFFSYISYAADLSEIFPIQKDPGSGKFVSTIEKRIESIEIGKKSKLYALGFLFDLNTLPPKVKSDMGGRYVMQILCGSLLKESLPPFGSFSLIMPNANKETIFPVGNSKNKDSIKAMILFRSPGTGAEEAQRLMDTYFGTKGEVGVKTLKNLGKIKLKSGGKNLLFEKKAILLEVEAELMTPFNSQLKNVLKGQIYLPLYSAADEATKSFISTTLWDSLSALTFDTPKEALAK